MRDANVELYGVNHRWQLGRGGGLKSNVVFTIIGPVPSIVAHNKGG